MPLRALQQGHWMRVISWSGLLGSLGLLGHLLKAVCLRRNLCFLPTTLWAHRKCTSSRKCSTQMCIPMVKSASQSFTLLVRVISILFLLFFFLILPTQRRRSDAIREDWREVVTSPECWEDSPLCFLSSFWAEWWKSGEYRSCENVEGWKGEVRRESSRHRKKVFVQWVSHSCVLLQSWPCSWRNVYLQNYWGVFMLRLTDQRCRFSFYFLFRF